MPEEAEENVGQVVEHLFRQEAGKIIAALTGAFGLRYLELAEDALQEALLQAPGNGPTENSRRIPRLG